MTIPLDLANLVSVIAGLLVLGACVLLWLRHQTLWPSLALAGQLVAVVCRLVLFVPDGFARLPLLRVIWPVGVLVFAIGLAGHAWTEYQAAQRSAKS
jgi:hypothetical protein